MIGRWVDLDHPKASYRMMMSDDGVRGGARSEVCSRPQILVLTPPVSERPADVPQFIDAATFDSVLAGLSIEIDLEVEGAIWLYLVSELGVRAAPIVTA